MNAYRVVWNLGERGTGRFGTDDTAEAERKFRAVRQVIEEHPGTGWVSLNAPPRVLKVYPPFKPTTPYRRAA